MILKYMYGTLWAQRGFVRPYGIKIAHREAIADILHAMTLSIRAGHITDLSLITKGNLTDLTSLTEVQEAVSIYEKSVWVRHGAVSNINDSLCICVHCPSVESFFWGAMR